MTNKEAKEIYKVLNDIYCGILVNYSDFQSGDIKDIVYDFSCPKYQELINRYHIDEIAGKGSDFVRAKRLLNYLAPRLTHESNYDNHIECNSLKLLEYSLNNPKQGINCLNKSKILTECCLALGIYARRVIILPYSPYDFDNHVVTEIFDRKMNKWIMLDPTTNGYFIDENKTPLSMLEIRNKFKDLVFTTFVDVSKPIGDIKKKKEKYYQLNNYICKNCFCFILESYNGFGEKGEDFTFIPNGYSLCKNRLLNTEYRLKNMPEELKSKFANHLKQRIEKLEKEVDNPADITVMIKAPFVLDQRKAKIF